MMARTHNNSVYDRITLVIVSMRLLEGGKRIKMFTGILGKTLKMKKKD